MLVRLACERVAGHSRRGERCGYRPGPTIADLATMPRPRTARRRRGERTEDAPRPIPQAEPEPAQEPVRGSSGGASWQPPRPKAVVETAVFVPAARCPVRLPSEDVLGAWVRLDLPPGHALRVSWHYPTTPTW